MEGTYLSRLFKGLAPGSDVRYGWHLPPVDKKNSPLLTVVESPIDALSLCVIRPAMRKGHILSLNGLHQVALERFLEKHSQVKVVNLALDTDAAGLTATRKLASMVREHGCHVHVLRPGAGDWNEMLKTRQ